MGYNKGFDIELNRKDRIYEQFKAGTKKDQSECLGELSLLSPLNKIEVRYQSDGEYFSILSNLYFGKKTVNYNGRKYDETIDIPIPENSIKREFETKLMGDSLYILNKEGKFEYEINKSSDWFYISAGPISNFHDSSTPQIKIGTLEEFINQLEKYKKLIETAVDSVYIENINKKENIGMFWNPQTIRTKGLFLDEMVSSEELKKKIEIKNPQITFKEIGGQDKAKREIEGLSFALKNPELYKKWGTKPPKGILLHGPPGTGKTLMAKALATDVDAKFYHVKVSDINNMWYGMSEKIMQKVFDIAKENKKSIIFFDELDALASHRDYSHEASGKIVSTMLENLDGINSSDNIMVIGSTNRLDSIDKALTRPGRIDRLVEVPLPDGKGREKIFGIHKTKAEKIAERKLFDVSDYKEIINKTENYSGADIAEIIRRVLEEKVRQEGSNNKEPESVIDQDITKQITNYERTKELKNKIGFITKDK